MLQNVLIFFFFFFFNDTATTEIYTLSYTTLFRSVVSPCDLVGAAGLGGLFQVALGIAEGSGAAVRVTLAGFAAIGIPTLGQGGGDAVGAVAVDQLLLADAAQIGRAHV